MFCLIQNIKSESVATWVRFFIIAWFYTWTRSSHDPVDFVKLESGLVGSILKISFNGFIVLGLTHQSENPGLELNYIQN